MSYVMPPSLFFYLAGRYGVILRNCAGYHQRSYGSRHAYFLEKFYLFFPLGFLRFSFSVPRRFLLSGRVTIFA